jgi:hypothetical protein
VTSPAKRPPVRRNIQLLATVHEADDAATSPRKYFGNIIELGSRAMILETNRELETGAALTVNVVFPGQPRGDDPFARLHCTVRKAHDNRALQYDLSILDMDQRTSERLHLYLNRSAGVEAA